MDQPESQKSTWLTQIKRVFIVYAITFAFYGCFNFLQKHVDLVQLTLAILSVLAVILMLYILFMLLVTKLFKDIRFETKSVSFDSNTSPKFKATMKILRIVFGCFLIVQPAYFYLGLKVGEQAIGDILSNCAVLIVGIYILIGALRAK